MTSSNRSARLSGQVYSGGTEAARYSGTEVARLPTLSRTLMGLPEAPRDGLFCMSIINKYQWGRASGVHVVRGLGLFVTGQL